MCHENFQLNFFSLFEPIWAPDKQVKSVFAFFYYFPRILQFLIQTPWCASYRRVNPSKFLRSQEHTISKKTLQYASHRHINPHSVHHTAESIFVVCITRQSQSLWCASHGRVNLCGVHHTAESNYTQNWNLHLSLVAFKGTIRRNPLGGEYIYHERKNFKHKMLIF